MIHGAPTLPTAWFGHGLRQPLILVACLIGLLPFIAGVMFRTYTYVVSPAWYEGLRQFDIPFIAVELAIFCYAREKGLNLRELFAGLDRRSQAAIAVFLATFWVGSVFVSDHPGYSAVRAAFWFVHLGFGCAIYHLCRQGGTKLDRAFGSAIILGFLACLPSIAVHIALAPEPHMQPKGGIMWQSALPGFLSVRQFGFLAATVLVLALGRIWQGDKGGSPLAAQAVVAISTAALLWSGTRTGVVGAAAAFVILILLTRRLPPLAVSAGTAVALLIGTLLSTLFLPPDPAFGIFRMAAPAVDTINAASVDTINAVSSNRLVQWRAAWDAFLGQPLFGTGEGSFYWLAPIERGFHVQPHNFVLQMLMNWGMPAAVAAFYLLWRLWKASHWLAISTPAVLPTVMLIDCSIAMAMFDGVLYSSRTVMLVAAAFAICLVRAGKAGEPSFARLKAA